MDWKCGVALQICMDLAVCVWAAGLNSARPASGNATRGTGLVMRGASAGQIGCLAGCGLGLSANPQAQACQWLSCVRRVIEGASPVKLEANQKLNQPGLKTADCIAHSRWLVISRCLLHRLVDLPVYPMVAWLIVVQYPGRHRHHHRCQRCPDTRRCDRWFHHRRQPGQHHY